MIDNPSKIITIEDVMEMLAISSKKTIYTYIQQGKLHPINKDDWHIEGRYEFDLEDVVRLKEELKSQDLRQKK
ncbi:helix-turn-helix domain-containing protein (plasmid) [Bacillus megaterium]|nr:helix-turn-helix domain-containing protein [Priestia megaterium]